MECVLYRVFSLWVTKQCFIVVWRLSHDFMLYWWNIKLSLNVKFVHSHLVVTCRIIFLTRVILKNINRRICVEALVFQTLYLLNFVKSLQFHIWRKTMANNVHILVCCMLTNLNLSVNGPRADGHFFSWNLC